MGTRTGTRRVRFEKFVDYIQANYRTHLNANDYEILTTIANDYTAEEIQQALNYCVQRKSNSLKYLHDALIKKYYQTTEQSVEPSWLRQEIKQEPIDDDDKIFAREFYKTYCSNEVEALEKIKKMGLEV